MQTKRGGRRGARPCAPVKPLPIGLLASGTFLVLFCGISLVLVIFLFVPALLVSRVERLVTLWAPVLAD